MYSQDSSLDLKTKMCSFSVELCLEHLCPVQCRCMWFFSRKNFLLKSLYDIKLMSGGRYRIPLCDLDIGFDLVHNTDICCMHFVITVMIILCWCTVGSNVIILHYTAVIWRHWQWWWYMYRMQLKTYFFSHTFINEISNKTITAVRRLII